MGADPRTPTDPDRILRALREARTRLEAAERRHREPVAIIAMGCRFPGGADDPDAFWELLESGRDAIAELPPGRWDPAAWQDPDPEIPGKIYTHRGGWLRDIDRFDPGLFGIAPREARSLDPQQRLLLEVAWEALERSGRLPEPGSATGVFVGIGQNDYAQLALRRRDPAAIGPYDGTGNGLCFAAGRLSYVLGLRGPCLALDTACSSSLLAVHLAVQSLRAGECDLALAGGVQLALDPRIAVFLSRTRALAPDGRCKAFDAAADGFGRGEGCGLVVLKRLADARADGDRVLAVIRGSASNHDGPGSGLTVPSEAAQEQLLRRALRDAGLQPRDMGYIETHGTGTALGDPIEVGALGTVFGAPRPRPLLLGAVKAAIGHLEAAAGIAGLIKTVLILERRRVPAQPRFGTPNPRIPWAGLPLRVADRPLPLAGDPPRAGVSSFGMAGSNVHVVLEAAQHPLGAGGSSDAVRSSPHPTDVSAWRLFPFSARDGAALEELLGRHRRHLAAHPDLDPAAVARTLALGRRHLPLRLAVAARDRAELLAALEPGRAGPEPAGTPRVAFLFTGQGSQYPGMGRGLYQSRPVFREAVDRCAAVLDPLLERPLTDLLFADDPAIHATGNAQPALFALGYALARLWQSWGVEPAALIGHSLGELTAACLAGVFSLEDGLRLAAARGRLMQALPGDGAMAAVFAKADRVAAALAPHAAEAAIAGYNEPGQVVISGSRRALAAVLAALGAESRELTVSHAFHSPLMEPMADDFRRVLAGIPLQPPRLPLVSCLSGGWADAAMADPDYWVRHALEPVRFAAGAAALAGAADTFLELGPQPVLLAMARRGLGEDGRAWLPSLRRGRDEDRALLDSLGRLYVRGLDPDWRALAGDGPRTELPTYPFQRQRYWLDDALPDPAPVSPVGRLLERGDLAGLQALLAAELSPAAREQAPAILAALLRGHRQEAGAGPPDWCYGLDWRPAAPAPGPARGGDWLLLVTDAEPAHDLAAILGKRGGRVIRALPGERLARQDADTWTVPPADPGAFRALLAALDRPPAGAVHLWSLDRAIATAHDLEDFQARIGGGALHLVQALDAATPLWLVTRGAVAVAGDTPDPAPATLWGLGRVLALERPTGGGGSIDLDPADPAPWARLAELLDCQGEDQLALRGGQIFAPRLRPLPAPASGPPALRDDAVYLISGGLGAIGLAAARWLTDHGARRLLLLGRRPPGERARPVLEDLARRGVRVDTAQADVADPAALEPLLAALDRPLGGVIHAAGAPGYRPLAALDLAAWLATLRPKVLGGWLLDRLAPEAGFFVCLSSIAAAWGSRHQAHYAAANAFLDSLAAARHGAGRPALSIAWGPWKLAGMADESHQARLAELGITALDPAPALDLMGALIGAGRPYTVAAAVDWGRFRAVFEARGPRPLLAELPGKAAAPAGGDGAVAERLRALPPAERRRALLNHLQAELAAALGFADPAAVAPERGFFELGMDSMMAVDLKNRLQAQLGRTLPGTLAFDCPDLARLTDYLAREVLGWDLPAAPGPAAVPETTDPDPDLAARLERLEHLTRLS